MAKEYFYRKIDAANSRFVASLLRRGRQNEPNINPEVLASNGPSLEPLIFILKQNNSFEFDIKFAQEINQVTAPYDGNMLVRELDIGYLKFNLLPVPPGWAELYKPLDRRGRFNFTHVVGHAEKTLAHRQYVAHRQAGLGIFEYPPVTIQLKDFRSLHELALAGEFRIQNNPTLAFGALAFAPHLKNEIERLNP